MMLDALDYEADAIAGWAEALDRLMHGAYVVVVTDLVMPGVSG
jgi:CheY-like chemotaxis protein